MTFKCRSFLCLQLIAEALQRRLKCAAVAARDVGVSKVRFARTLKVLGR